MEMIEKQQQQQQQQRESSILAAIRLPLCHFTDLVFGIRASHSLIAGYQKCRANI